MDQKLFTITVHIKWSIVHKNLKKIPEIYRKVTFGPTSLKTKYKNLEPFLSQISEKYGLWNIHPQSFSGITDYLWKSDMWLFRYPTKSILGLIILSATWLLPGNSVSLIREQQSHLPMLITCAWSPKQRLREAL